MSPPAQVLYIYLFIVHTRSPFAKTTRQSWSCDTSISFLVSLKLRVLLLPPASGLYCATAELAAPSGPCEAGFYCTGGSMLPNPMGGAVGNICPRGHFCPAGSSSPSPCPPGRFASSCCIPAFLFPVLGELLSSSEAVPLFCSPLLFCTEACLYVAQGAAAVSTRA